jgi:hypothetical protein
MQIQILSFPACVVIEVVFKQNGVFVNEQMVQFIFFHCIYVEIKVAVRVTELEVGSITLEWFSPKMYNRMKF